MRGRFAVSLIVLVVWGLTLRADEKTPDGFRPLFNGRDLSGWKIYDGRIEAWGVENGVLSASGEGGGWLMTEDEFADFELRLEYKVPEAGNSGVAVRAPRQGNPAYDGMEIQILDDAGHKDLRPAQHTGSIYDVVPPSKQATKPAGEWNKMRIIAKGRRVSVEVNGTKVVDANLVELIERADKHPGLLRATGHLGFQSHGTKVEFRHIYVKSLQ